jgi:hypothetical protein
MLGYMRSHLHIISLFSANKRILHQTVPTRSKKMTIKLYTNIFIPVIILCTIAMTKVNGQKRVIGTIAAEVIESVNASSSIITDFSIKNTTVTEDSLLQVGVYLDPAPLDMGTFTVNPGESMACSIDLNEATLTDNKGNSFTIEPSTVTSGNADTLRADGIQTLYLNGTASMAPGLASGYYEGSYNLIVIFN